MSCSLVPIGGSAGVCTPLLLLLLLLLVRPPIRAGADVTIMGRWTPPLIAPLAVLLPGVKGKGNQGRIKNESDCADASLGTQSRNSVNSHTKSLPPKSNQKLQFRRGGDDV